MRHRLQVHAFAVAIVAAFLAATVNLNAQPLTISHLAGPRDTGPGWFDGAGNGARFQLPSGLATDGSGSIFIADTANQTIRKYVVTTGGPASESVGSIVVDPVSPQTLHAASRELHP